MARGHLGPDSLRQLARFQEDGGRLREARQTLEVAFGQRPDSVETLLDLARVSHKAGDLRGALGYLAHARERAPKDARVHFFFGLVCVDLELGAEAIASLQEAVRLEPENASINYAMGAVALHGRDASEALPYFRKYAALRPDDPRGGFALGIAAFQARDFATARERLRPAASRPETRAAASYFLARMAREENDLEAALRSAEDAVAAKEDYADAWAELGLVQFRRREHERAEAALRRCLELDPRSYHGNLHLLMLYERTKDPRREEQARAFEAVKGEREEKAEDFRRVIEVRPY
jgi:tetratricopeptide (TPR) repeat protein